MVASHAASLDRALAAVHRAVALHRAVAFLDRALASSVLAPGGGFLGQGTGGGAPGGGQGTGSGAPGGGFLGQGQ